MKYRNLRCVLAFSLPLAIALGFGARFAPDLIETLYARGIYRGVSLGLAFLTGWLPFSVAETLLAAGAVWIVWRVARFAWALARPSEPRVLILRRAAATALIVPGLLALSFLLLWGLNYHRRPLPQLLSFDTRGSTASELATYCSELADQASRVRAGLPEDADGVMAPVDALAEAQAAYASLGRKWALVRGTYGRPKRSLLSPILSRLNVTGVYSPFTGEPHINGTIPAPSMPAIVCHEIAHQRGFAAEDEATFVGVLACRASDNPAVRYSGIFASLEYSLAALASVDAAAASAIMRRLGDGVRRDMRAWGAWKVRFREVSPAVTSFASRAYDSYLKINAQEDGLRSYGRVVDLLLAERRSSIVRAP